MYAVRVGEDRVEVITKEDADKLITMLNMLDCPGQISKQEIRGNEITEQLYTLECLDDTITIIGLDYAIKAEYWLMHLGMPGARVNKKEDKKCGMMSGKSSDGTSSTGSAELSAT